MKWVDNTSRATLGGALAFWQEKHPEEQIRIGLPSASAHASAEQLGDMGVVGLYRVAAGERFGDWLQTYSGRKFYPLDPRPEDVAIEDIAHALANTCRYAGHSLCFYSVAEHAVQVSLHVPPQHALWGLLHDAAEAYTADIPRPLKPFLFGWKEIEARVMRAVCDHFGLPHAEPPEVKAVDAGILADEKFAVMEDGPAWGSIGAPIGAEIRGLSPMEAKIAFLARFHALTRGGAVPA
jgi:hypothetical protein